MLAGRWILVLGLAGVVGVGSLAWSGRAVAGSPASPEAPAGGPEQLAARRPLLDGAAAAQTARAALERAGAAADLAARGPLVERAQAEAKRARKALARAVDRAREAGDKARAAELGRLNVELSRLVRDLDAAQAAGEPEAALVAAARRAAGLGDALAGIGGDPPRRVLGLALWRTAIGEDDATRGALAGALGAALLAALEAGEPKPDPDLVRRCRAAVAAVGASTPPAVAAGWSALARVAAEVTEGS